MERKVMGSKMEVMFEYNGIIIEILMINVMECK